MRKVVQSACLGVAIGMTGCGGSSSGGGSETEVSTPVSVLFSDAPVESAEKVVITVDAITFRREGADDIVVDSFTSSELGVVDADTFQIDLLEVQGNDNRLVIDTVDLPVGEYTNLLISVLDEDVNLSYVEEVGSGDLKPIKVPSDVLKLGGFTVGDLSTQSFVVEFGLRQSLVYNPGPDRYILKPRGVRVVDLEDASTILGSVDIAALHTLTPCDAKLDTQINNTAYLYTGHDLDTNLLGDVFVREADAEIDEDFDENVPADIIAPVVAVEIEGGEINGYLFSYLHPGDYTLAVSCEAEADDPVIYDGISVPSPATEIVELSLGVEQNLVCDFPLAEGECGNITP